MPKQPRRKSPAPVCHALDDFDELVRTLGSKDAVRDLLGGKGANLAEMTSLGLPVPPGFVVTTAACRAFLDHRGRWPDGLRRAVERARKKLERATGKRLGDPKRPLLVAVRSGARVSMPGMMDTVLDLGMTAEVAERLADAGEARFAFDCRRRLVQMYGRVVCGVADEVFDGLLAERRRRRGVPDDASLDADDLRELTTAFLSAIEQHTGEPMPTDPHRQLEDAIAAVFRSWNGPRAQRYRRAAGIPDDLGTAANVVAMVFGNRDADSATGVATTRNVTTGAREIEGDFLVGAQGEDVVSGTRETLRIAAMEDWQPKLWRRLQRMLERLERHFGDVQDVEFTVERGELWMLQTRAAKRTAQAAIRIAVELAQERRIDKREALRRVAPAHVDHFLHPQLEPAARRDAAASGRLLATGLDVSPGAAIGRIVFDADTAERLASGGERVILVRAETRPDDVHGLLAAEGVVTSRGGRTSHAALVARQFGKPAVVGALRLEVNAKARRLRAPGGIELGEDDWLSLDGTTGEVFAGELPTLAPDLDDPHLTTLLGWADQVRYLGVLANADRPVDAARAHRFGAEGIGLCRTEHMFFEADRLPIVQAMILADDDDERAAHLAKLLPLQRRDFEGLFRAMPGLPVTIRLLDPPLHEFLPDRDALLRETTALETRLSLGDGDADALGRELAARRAMLAKVEELREQNPMLGRRGVRLGLHLPEVVRMQVRAIFQAACRCKRDGVKVRPKVMIPLASTAAELRIEREQLELEARAVLDEEGVQLRFQFGTMIEVPRAALVAGQLAAHAEFFSFGTNDLTQTTFGISRDDAETGFLTEYLARGILHQDPFATIDEEGVGRLMSLACEQGRAARPDIELGICGEHGGEPRSIDFCDRIGLDYVSCSPFRVPVARLAAAHATLRRAAAKPHRQK